MKSNIEQVHHQQLSPIYWISGDDPLLLDEARQTIYALATQHGFTEKERHEVDASFDWDQFSESIQSLSLFSEKSLIELRCENRKLSDAAKKQLSEYASNPPDDKILLILTGKVDKRSQTTKWFQSIEKHAIFIQIWPISPAQLPQWIQRRLQQANMTADPAAIRFIAEHIEGNLLAGKQAIEKLRLLHDKKHLTLEDVISAIHDSAHYDIFALMDSALNGNTIRTSRIFVRLKEEGTEPTIILWALARELRMLLSMHQDLKSGKEINSVLQQHGVWDKRKPIVQMGLRRHNIKTLISLLQQAGKIDQIIKGALKDNLWIRLHQLTLKLCGHERVYER